MMERTSLVVSVRKKGGQMIAARIFSAFMGPSFITNWVIKVVWATSHRFDEVEYKIGENGAWTNL